MAKRKKADIKLPLTLSEQTLIANTKRVSSVPITDYGCLMKRHLYDLWYKRPVRNSIDRYAAYS